MIFMPRPLYYSFADGNANRYIITTASVRYEPVQPAYSSTGIYSGGNPCQKSLSPAAYHQLQALFEKALSSKDCATTTRTKMSGMLTRIAPHETTTVILRAGSDICIEIETKLRELLKR
jgi:hypothetical protein